MYIIKQNNDFSSASSQVLKRIIESKDNKKRKSLFKIFKK